MVAAVPLFAFPNAIGGNMVRLVGVIGIPLAGAVLWSLRRRFVVLVVPLMVWQLGPAMSSVHAPAEASAEASYYEPMVTAVSGLTDGVPTRIEIPFTASHWEAAYAGPHLMLARGWERQTDRALNAELYEDDLLHSDYQAWLLDNAVSYVALPAVELDPGSVREGELIASHPVYLEPVWTNTDWQVFEVLRAEPLASAGALLTGVEPDALDLFVSRAGTCELRFQFSDHLSVTSGNGCLFESENGWTELEVRSGGFVRLSSAVSEVGHCADAPAEDQ